MTKMDGDPLAVGLFAAEHSTEETAAMPSRKSVKRKCISVDPWQAERGAKNATTREYQIQARPACLCRRHGRTARTTCRSLQQSAIIPGRREKGLRISTEPRAPLGAFDAGLTKQF